MSKKNINHKIFQFYMIWELDMIQFYVDCHTMLDNAGGKLQLYSADRKIYPSAFLIIWLVSNIHSGASAGLGIKCNGSFNISNGNFKGSKHETWNWEECIFTNKKIVSKEEMKTNYIKTAIKSIVSRNIKAWALVLSQYQKSNIDNMCLHVTFVCYSHSFNVRENETIRKIIVKGNDMFKS